MLTALRTVVQQPQFQHLVAEGHSLEGVLGSSIFKLREAKARHGKVMAQATLAACGGHR